MGQKFFDYPLGFFRPRNLNAIHACFLGGVIVSAGIEGITDKNGLAERNTEVFFDLTDAIGLIDAFSSYIDRS